MWGVDANMKKIGLGSRPSEIKQKDKSIELDHEIDAGARRSTGSGSEGTIITKRPVRVKSAARNYLFIGIVLALLAGAGVLLNQLGAFSRDGLQNLFSFTAALDYIEFVTADRAVAIQNGEHLDVAFKDGLNIKRTVCKGWYKLFPPEALQVEVSEIGKLPNYYQDNIIPLLKPEKTCSYTFTILKNDHPIGAIHVTLKLNAQDWVARAESVTDTENKNICFKNAIRENPDSETARLGLAKSFEQKKQVKNAVTEYEEIIKKNPRNRDVLAALIPLYIQTKKTGKLIETYKNLATIETGKADDYFYKAGTVAEKSGSTAEAIDLYKKSVAARGANADARQKLIKLYEKENKWDLVAEQTRELVKQDPKNANLYLYLSDVYLKLNRLDQAIAEAEKAAKLNPKDASIQLQCALLYEKAKKDDKAIEAYKKLVVLNTKNATAYNNLGMLQEKKSDRKSAIPQYEKAVSLDPGNKVFLINLADAYEKEKEWDKAITSYEKVVQIDRGNTSAWEALAVLCQKAGKKEEVIKAYRELSRIEPKKVLWHQRLAALYEEQGNLAAAKKEYKAILRLNPNDKGAKQKLLDISIKSLQKKLKKGDQSQRRDIDRKQKKEYT
jgi:tetratricopeptide (TPR) repeat protein